MRDFFSILFLASFCTPIFADEAKVLDVEVTCNKSRLCRFSVTVEHADTGWQHYADRWEILSPDGEVLGTRVLAHPHVNEQPFTRSLRNVPIPDGVDEVVVRVRDSVHGYGSRERTVVLPK